MRKPYPSDLTDARWAILGPLIPVATTGRPRLVDIREVLNAIFYQARSGCQWDILPHDLPARSTVNGYFRQWRDDGTWQVILDALRRKVRVAAGRDPNPGVVYLDSQTVKGTEVGGVRGYDGGKKIGSVATGGDWGVVGLTVGGGRGGRAMVDWITVPFWEG